MNRDLIEKVCPIPDSVPHHDWWITLVAAAFGRIVALPEATVLYRRHSENHTGEYTKMRNGLRQWTWRILGSLGRTDELRQWLTASAKQAEMFLYRFESDLPREAQVMLKEYAEIPRLGLFKRKLRVLRLQALPKHGIIRKLGLLLRA